MTTEQQRALQITVDVFHKKCQSLAKHRRPNIYLKSNDELFSDWFEDSLNEYNILKLGANTHPDLVIDGVGMELKSLRGNGQIQFNSTIPCGGFQHNDLSGECYYAIARYTTERQYGYLEDFTICDGDYFNHDHNMAFAHQNQQETGFGDYEDGVVRHRKMYSFPSPLKTVEGISFISKFDNAEQLNGNLVLDGNIERIDKHGKTFNFYVYRHRALL